MRVSRRPRHTRRRQRADGAARRPAGALDRGGRRVHPADGWRVPDDQDPVSAGETEAIDLDGDLGAALRDSIATRCAVDAEGTSRNADCLQQSCGTNLSS